MWKAAKVERITLHECRHTFASLMIAAGVNAKALGHANISITLDRYGHLVPGSEDQAAGLLDAYLVERLQEKGSWLECVSVECPRPGTLDSSSAQEEAMRPCGSRAPADR